jgi:hypothetical protein
MGSVEARHLSAVLLADAVPFLSGQVTEAYDLPELYDGFPGVAFEESIRPSPTPQSGVGFLSRKARAETRPTQVAITIIGDMQHENIKALALQSGLICLRMSLRFHPDVYKIYLSQWWAIGAMA